MVCLFFLQEGGQDDGNCSDCTIYEDIDELVQQFDLTMKETMDQVQQMKPSKKTKKSKGKGKKDQEGNIVGKVGWLVHVCVTWGQGKGRVRERETERERERERERKSGRDGGHERGRNGYGNTLAARTSHYTTYV